jgi:uncharacterized phage-associated protein
MGGMQGERERLAAARYVVNTAKTVEVILWLANAKPGIDMYHVVKCAFFADKAHLNRYGRPVTGDDYDADTYGPLGRAVYGLLRRNPIHMLALDSNGELPFRVLEDRKWLVEADRGPDHKLLSPSDVEALEWALGEVGNLSFEELVELTHQEPAYIAANGGRMRYEDLLDASDPDRDEKAADLAESAPQAVL